MDIIPLLNDPRAVEFFRVSGDTVIVPDEPFEDIADLCDYLERFPEAVIVTDIRHSTIEGGLYLPRLVREAGYLNPIVGTVDLKDETEGFNELKAKYLEQGGDDLLEAPVSPLLFRSVASAMTRRMNGRKHDILSAEINGHRVMVHVNAVVVTVDGQPIHLTGKEYAMVLALASRPGTVITKEMFLDRLYGALDDEPEIKIIDVFICKVRKKFEQLIGKDNAAELIETIWGRGYRWKAGVAAGG